MNQLLLIIILLSVFLCKKENNIVIKNIPTSNVKEIKKNIDNHISLKADRYSRIGVINAPNGHINLLKKPNFKAEIVTKILDDDYFLYQKISNSNWSKVKTLKEEEGYVHNSKIKDIKNDELISVSIFDYERAKDTIINISSFNDSATFLINDFNYKKIEHKAYFSDSLIVFSEGRCEIKISKGLYKVESDKIEYEGNFIASINGEKPWGAENKTIAPKYYVSNISIDNKIVSKHKIKNLFQPNLDYIKVFKRSGDGNYIIFMLNGDGSDAYNVVFFIKKKNILKRFIYRPF